MVIMMLTVHVQLLCFQGFLNHFSKNVHFYQPDRHKEGYGISLESVKWMASKNIDLVVALDCGIRDF
jgi:single-stranded-DNA-specific exonuclease